MRLRHSRPPAINLIARIRHAGFSAQATLLENALRSSDRTAMVEALRTIRTELNAPDLVEQLARKRSETVWKSYERWIRCQANRFENVVTKASEKISRWVESVGKFFENPAPSWLKRIRSISLTGYLISGVALIGLVFYNVYAQLQPEDTARLRHLETAWKGMIAAGVVNVVFLGVGVLSTVGVYVGPFVLMGLLLAGTIGAAAVGGVLTAAGLIVGTIGTTMAAAVVYLRALHHVSKEIRELRNDVNDSLESRHGASLTS